MKEHVWGALFYASVPFLIAVYLLLIDAGILKDSTGHDDFYQWIKEYRVAFLVLALLLMAFAVFEFFRFIDSFREAPFPV